MEATIKKNFPVTGLSCASCAISVESMLKAQKGVVDASVNYANSSAWVEYQPNAKVDEFKTAIQSIGYDILIEEEGHHHQEEIQQAEYRKLRFNTVGASLLALPVVIIAMFMMGLPYANWIMMALTIPVIGWFGRGFFINAWKQASHGKANMDTLVALSTGIAFIFSSFSTFYPEFWHARHQHAAVYFEASTVIIAFILLGRMLEEKAKSNTSSALKKLIGLQPSTVTMIQSNGQEKEMAISQVVVGDQLVVKPGEKIPVDGEIVSGSSFIDESTITGESLAVEKDKGAKVFAGTINQKGSFVFVAQQVGGATILARIIKMVGEAQGSKPPVQKLVDKVAGIFVPVVMGISILSLIGWLILGGENSLTQGLLAMVSVLVIACPCALGLATPTAIMVGIGKGAENGILIKDAESLELGHKVNAVVLDKTGTITEGKPAVTDIWWNGNTDKAAFENILYAIESQSEHPLAEAVTASLKVKAAQRMNFESFESITGRGVMAKDNGNVYLVGNLKLLEQFKVNVSQEALNLVKSWQQEAKTVIAFAHNSELMAVIAIADQIKETSAKAIRELQNRGIEVHMLTGDNMQTAAAVAQKAGVSSYKAEVMPEDKAEFVKQLQQQGKIVAMVGDGINDSQALAQADVSIAMGRGSDIAMDVARMTIISSDLQLIGKALRLSKQTVGTVKENLFWAFIYNLIGIPIAAGILYPLWGFMLNPMIAGAAMALSSVSVVSNSLRLKVKKLD